MFLVPGDTHHVPQGTPHAPAGFTHEPQAGSHVYSGDWLAKYEAAIFAFAFVVAWHSDADPFHTWAAWVTKVSPPLRGLRPDRSLLTA
jgi:hypothetical protein